MSPCCPTRLRCSGRAADAVQAARRGAADAWRPPPSPLGAAQGARPQRTLRDRINDYTRLQQARAAGLVGGAGGAIARCARHRPVTWRIDLSQRRLHAWVPTQVAAAPQLRVLHQPSLVLFLLASCSCTHVACPVGRHSHCAGVPRDGPALRCAAAADRHRGGAGRGRRGSLPVGAGGAVPGPGRAGEGLDVLVGGRALRLFFQFTILCGLFASRQSEPRQRLLVNPCTCLVLPAMQLRPPAWLINAWTEQCCVQALFSCVPPP